MEFSLARYFSKKRWHILDAANLCMKAIEESGLSQSEALEVPFCLEGLIKRSNELVADKEPFKAKRVKIEYDGEGGMEIIELDQADD